MLSTYGNLKLPSVSEEPALQVMAPRATPAAKPPFAGRLKSIIGPFDDEDETPDRPHAMPATDRRNLAPQVRPVRNAGVTFVRDDQGAAKEPQTGHDAAQNEAPYPRLTAEQAVRHYMQGSGTPLRMDFAQLNTQWVLPTDFPQIKAELATVRQGALPREVKIDDNLPYKETGDNAHLVGNVTLRLQGTLTITEKGYEFRGTLKAWDDPYDFNRSTHRPFIDELKTLFGSLLPGKGFDIEIRGSRRLYAAGTFER